MNDVTVLGVRGLGFCVNSTRASEIKKRDDGGGESKNVQNYVTSF